MATARKIVQWYCVRQSRTYHVDAAGASKFRGKMAENRKFRWWRRWMKWPLIVLGVLVFLLYVVLPMIITPMIRNRLQRQLSSQLNADLQMGWVYYWFPYGVTVSDAVLVAKDQQGEPIRLLKIDKLKLALAHLP